MKIGAVNVRHNRTAGFEEQGGRCPALKHLFRCLESSGTTWTDSKGGIVTTPDILSFNAARKTVLVQASAGNQDAAIALTSGAWASFDGTGVLVLQAVGYPDHQFGYGVRGSYGGMGSGHGIDFPTIITGSSSSNTHFVLKGTDGATSDPDLSAYFPADPGGPVYVNPYLVDPGTIYSFELIYQPQIPSFNYRVRRYDSPNSYVWNLFSTAPTNVGVMTPAALYKQAGLWLYGRAVLTLAALPADLDQGLVEQMQMWVAGNRYIADRFIGLASA
jgi:hypothetical protein